MFSWAPEGNKYLIKVGDSLGIISDTTYGTSKYWKNIWTNNKPLIKDPNRIYAGFTIFTPIIEGREVANDSLNEL
jgi:nucleoid-associated protein YgaU